jgi:hypothetical protein
MKKFMLVYYGAQTAEESMKGDPAQMKAVMDAWGVWMAKCGKALVEMGNPLSNGETYTAAGSVKSTKHVTGYSLMQGESIEEIKKLLTGHPVLSHPGAEIGVHEILPM